LKIAYIGCMRCLLLLRSFCQQAWRLADVEDGVLGEPTSFFRAPFTFASSPSSSSRFIAAAAFDAATDESLP
jgi:hypothetical protein